MTVLKHYGFTQEQYENCGFRVSMIFLLTISGSHLRLLRCVTPSLPIAFYAVEVGAESDNTYSNSVSNRSFPKTLKCISQ